MSPSHSKNLTTNPPDENDSHEFLSGTIINAALTFISRILGMLRDVVTAALFGISASGVFDAFVLAFRLPNLFRRLFGEGAISISFLPAFCKQRQKNPSSAWELLTAAATMLSAILGALMLLGVAICAGIIHFLPGEHLATHLTLIMLPYLFLICQTAIFASALQGLKSWLAPALAPVVMNLLWLWGAVAFAPNFSSPQEQAYLIASIVSLSAAVQLILQLLALRKFGYRFQRCLFNRIAIYWRRATAGWITMATGLSLLQLCVVTDTVFAWFCCPTGTVSSVFLAERLFEFPLGLIGISVATAVYPLLNQHVAEKKFEAVKKDMSNAIHLALFWGVPSTAGLLLLGVPLCQILFEHGAATANDCLRIGNILAIYSGGVWAYCLIPILTRGFYAIGKIKIPAVIVFVTTLINTIVNVILSMTLSEYWLQYALAASTVVCICASTVILGGIWKLISVDTTTENSVKKTSFFKIIQKLFSSFINSKVLTIIFSTAIMAAAGQYVFKTFPHTPTLSARLINSVATVAVCMIVYLITMYFFWQPDIIDKKRLTGDKKS